MKSTSSNYIKYLNDTFSVSQVHLSPNKNFPNSIYPVIIYKKILRLPEQRNKAARIAINIFRQNSWTNSWKNGIYDFHHYHSITHEGMAICKGSANVLLGGPTGKRFVFNSGDVIVLPAGTAHKCSGASKDFFCVGVYPGGNDYDMNYGNSDELEWAIKNISKLSIPANDPLFGKGGFLINLWKQY